MDPFLYLLLRPFLLGANDIFGACLFFFTLSILDDLLSMRLSMDDHIKIDEMSKRRMI